MVAEPDLQRFKNLLDSSRNFLVLLPQNPNFDAVASGLSLYLALRAHEKEVTIACPSQMIVEFNRLVGVDKVRQELGGQNLSLTLDNYQAEEIEKVSYNIEAGKFNLLIVPKAGARPPRQEQVRIGYAGAAAEVVIIVGAKSRGELGKFSGNQDLFASQTNLVLLGNLPVQGFQNAVEVIDPAAACASAVVFQILEQANLPLDADISGNLLAGMRAGTNNFQGPQVFAETFAAAARLAQVGGPAQVAPPPSTQPPVHPESPEPPQESSQEPPEDWLAPKVYKGSTLP